MTPVSEAGAEEEEETPPRIVVGPRDAPSAQLGVGFETHTAWNGASSSNGPGVPRGLAAGGGDEPAEAEREGSEPEPGVNAVEQANSMSNADREIFGDQAKLANYLKKEGGKYIVQGSFRNVNPDKKSPTGLLSCKAGAIRNRQLTCLQSTLPAKELVKFITEDWMQSAFCVVAIETGSQALVIGRKLERVVLPEGISGGCLEKSAQVWRLLDNISRFEHYTTLECIDCAPSFFSAEEIMDMVRPFVNLNPAQFQATLMSMGTLPESKLTVQQKFVLTKKGDVVKLRAAVAEVEMCSSYITGIAADDVLELSQFSDLRLENVLWKNPDDNNIYSKPLTEFALDDIMNQCLVIGGKPDCGKTQLARSLARHFARAHRTSCVFQTSTVDSLRMLVQSFLKEYIPIVLDEWRMGADSQDSQAHKLDFVKVLTDVANPGAVRLRYSDLKFAENEARVITSQDTMVQWESHLQNATAEDKAAVLRRLVFLEPQRKLIKPEYVKEFKKKRVASTREAMMANGMLNPPAHTLGGWVPRTQT